MLEVKFTNLPKFIKSVDDSVTQFERFNRIPEMLYKTHWPQIRTKLVEMLISNLDELAGYPISTARKDTKKYKKIHNIPEVRYSGGGTKDVIVDDVNWMATGTLEETIRAGLFSDSDDATFSDGYGNISLNVDVSHLIDDDEFQEPYPIAVHEKIMSISGGEMGVMVLTDDQASRILEALTAKGRKLIKDLVKEMQDAS